MYLMQRKNKILLKDASKHPKEMQVKYWKNKKSENEKLATVIYINIQFFFIES